MTCCPAVVDPGLLSTLLGFVALATYLLQQLIVMTLMAGGRKRRSITDIFLEGKGTLFSDYKLAMISSDSQ